MSLKRLFQSAPVQTGLCRLLALYIRFVFHTTRWQWPGFEQVDRLAEAGETAIICFWHNRLAVMVYARRLPRTHHVIISPHRDGRLIAAIMADFGVRTIFASSSRRGQDGFWQAIALLEQGNAVCITPDGPRGPRMRSGFGAIDLARRSNAPLLPLAYSTVRRLVLNSWDRFIVPLPFGRGVFLAGEPMRVERRCQGAAREAARAEFERRMIELAAQADRLTGHAPIEAAPLAPSPEAAC